MTDLDEKRYSLHDAFDALLYSEPCLLFTSSKLRRRVMRMAGHFKGEPALHGARHAPPIPHAVHCEFAQKMVMNSLLEGTSQVWCWTHVLSAHFSKPPGRHSVFSLLTWTFLHADRSYIKQTLSCKQAS